jgi:hypothetical protein
MDNEPRQHRGQFSEIEPLNPLSHHDMLSKTLAQDCVPVRIER